MRLAGSTGRKNDAKNWHLCTVTQICQDVSSQLRHVWTIGKTLVKQQCVPHMPAEYGEIGPLAAEIGSVVWGTPTNFNGFHVLPLLLQRRRSPEANQTFRDVWPSICFVHYVYISGAVAPRQNFARCKIYFTSKSCVRLYWHRYCTALQQLTSAKLCGVVQVMELRNCRRGRHLYSAGRPSRWASAHILVLCCSTCVLIGECMLLSCSVLFFPYHANRLAWGTSP